MRQDRIKPTTNELPVLSRQGRKRVVLQLRAAAICCSLMSKSGVSKAIEAVTCLDDNELKHAQEWLTTAEAITSGIELDQIDKLQEIIKSVQRVRPAFDAAVAQAKALAKQPKADDVEKIKAQELN